MFIYKIYQKGRRRMYRLLIAESSGSYSKVIAKQLNQDFAIQCAEDGAKTLKLVRDFEPDILVLDLQLPDMDGITLLRTIRAANMYVKVVVLTRLYEDYIGFQLQELGVSEFFMKPARTSILIRCIRDLSLFKQTWCVENEADRILLDLGFDIGKGRYRSVYASVMFIHDNPDCYMTKMVYPAVAKQSGGNVQQTEKAIRDAIQAAWKHGNPHIWNTYFPYGKNGKGTCPSNEQFLTRIANLLRQQVRIKKAL